MFGQNRGEGGWASVAYWIACLVTSLTRLYNSGSAFTSVGNVTLHVRVGDAWADHLHPTSFARIPFSCAVALVVAEKNGRKRQSEVTLFFVLLLFWSLRSNSLTERYILAI